MDNSYYTSSSDCFAKYPVPAGYHFSGNVFKEFSHWKDSEESAINTFMADNKTEKRMMTIATVSNVPSATYIVFNIWEKDDV